MITTTYFAVSAQLVVKHGNELLRLEGKIGDAAGVTLFLQVHDSRAAAAAGAVPLESYKVTTAQTFFKEFVAGEFALANGLYVALSTTEATLTLANGNDKFSTLTVGLRDQDLPTGTSDTSTADDFSLQVWTNTVGKRIYYFKATNKESGVRYLQLFAITTFNGGEIPIMEWPLAAVGDSNGLNIVTGFFGKDGINPASYSAAHVVQTSCVFQLSTTAGSLSQASNEGMDLVVEYK